MDWLACNLLSWKADAYLEEKTSQVSRSLIIIDIVIVHKIYKSLKILLRKYNSCKYA